MTGSAEKDPNRGRERTTRQKGITGSLGFQAEGKVQVPRIKGSRRDQTDKSGKPSLGFGNNEVIGDLCSRGFNDVLQITGFEEWTGNEQVERKRRLVFNALG